MTQTLISTNLPVFFRCFRVPVEWKLGRYTEYSQLAALAALTRRGKGKPEQDSGFLSVRYSSGPATTYDPWEKRDEFFRLKGDDTEGLLKLLATVGLFERAGGMNWGVGEREDSPKNAIVRAGAETQFIVPYLSNFSVQGIWALRRLLQNSLESLDKHTGEQINFQAQIVRSKGRAQVNVTTMTFLEAILLTLSVDRVQKAKVLKCARPDCPVTFSFTGGHKRKYCSWDCGHLESVRRQRRKAKQATIGLESTPQSKSLKTKSRKTA
jgi:hypothetical protein